MLGSAPGTDLLNQWIASMVDDGMTLEDIANHIAASDAFQAAYPPLQTNREFATDMLDNLIGSEEVSGTLRAAAVDLVVGLLNGGMTRGALALAVVGELAKIHAQGEDHPAHGDLGGVAAAIANQIEVATYHTIEKRMADMSGDVLDGVTSDDATVAMAIRDIDSPPADAVFDMVGELSLTENADGSGMAGDENAPISVGHVTASDANGDAVTYSIKDNPDGWAILEDGKLCYVGSGVDYETTGSVDLTIVATSIGADGMATDVEQMVTVQIGDVDDLPDESMEYELIPGIDDWTGGDADDTIVAIPLRSANGSFQNVLEPFDTIDGGDGVDTIYITGAEDRTLSLGQADISNVENVVINTQGGINANLTDWTGVESVDLHRFGDDDNVEITVDGATVSTDETFGGEKAVIVGASGEVSIKASADTAVTVGSAEHTKSVVVVGGESVTIGKNANGGGQSETVTSVTVSKVAHTAATTTQEPSGLYNAMTNPNGFVVGQDGETPVTISFQNATGVTSIAGTAGEVEQVGLADDGVTLTNAITGDPITVTHDWNDDGVSTTGTVLVTVQLKFNQDNGRLVFGDIVTVGDDAFAGTDPDDPSDDVTKIEVRTDETNADGDRIAKDITVGALDGMRVPPGVAFTSRAIGIEDAGGTNPVMVGGEPTLTVNSDAIADLTLASTTATVIVHNNSMTSDKKPMPEDLSITVDGYGKKDTNDGNGSKLCLTGMGSADDITLTVEGDSWVDLNSNAVKMLDINADAKLSLGVRKFNSDSMMPTGASETLASVMVSGEGNVTMDSLQGMKKLASIDASASSGDNSFMSDEELAALTMAMGGSGNDEFDLVTTLDGKLASIDTGDGDDSVSISGDYREDGLMVDLGDGDDKFDGSAGNSMSRVDGGDGDEDVLKLSANGATYKDGDKTMSIYSNFEILDVGGGSGKYNVGLLDVDSIEIGESTRTGGVELDNVGGGTKLKVSAEEAGTGTTAVVTYNFANDVNVAGSIIDGGTTNILNVDLMAMGSDEDSKDEGDQSGIADLTITLDQELLAMSIVSEASVHSTAARNGATSGHYRNKVTVDGDSSALEEVKITGDAMTELSGSGLTSLQYVNATESGAGVTVDASANTTADATATTVALTATRVRLVGSDHKDELTAGDFDGTTVIARNILMGNGGDDILTGGAGRDLLNGGAGADMLKGFSAADETTAGVQRDLFVYNAASDSQVSFNRKSDGTYEAKGYDIITGFDSGTDDTSDGLQFSKTLFALATAGGIKAGDEWGVVTAENTTPGEAADGPGWMAVDSDGVAGGDKIATTTIDGDTNLASLGADGEVGGGDDVAADGGAADLMSFIDNGKGLFMTKEVGQTGDFGASTTDVKNSLAIISQTAAAEGGAGIWLLFDIDGDGDFDADTDMVIFLAGADAAFVAADLMSA